VMTSSLELAQQLGQQTYLPDETTHGAEVGKVFDFLARHQARYGTASPGAGFPGGDLQGRDLQGRDLEGRELDSGESQGVQPRYVLSGPDLHEQVELPPEVHRALLQVVTALKAGKAVTVVPQNTSLTTQQAADVLAMSRPTLVKLLESGQIPFERVNHRRKVLLRDVLAFREQRRQAQHDALAQMSVDLDDEDDAQAVLASLRDARRITAARRAQRQEAHQGAQHGGVQQGGVQQGVQQDLVADPTAGETP
jgi:excisionase family DNA binding protein